jgi:hypothetical protein
MIPCSRRTWWIILVMLVTIQGCSGAKVTTKSAPQIEKYRIQKIAVVPFEASSTPQAFNLNGPSLSVPAGAKASDISVAVPPTTETHPRLAMGVPPSAADKVTNLMWSKLKNKSGIEVISPAQVGKAAAEVKRAENAESLEALGQRIASRLGVDAALIGTVTVYQERVGSRVGASPPATVAFEMKLVGNDGAVIWEGNYYERQRPMSEDLWGFIQRYGAFVTADELAAYGSEQLAQEFPFGGPAQK